MMSRLRMQNFVVIGQGVPALHVLTDRQTQVQDLLYRCASEAKCHGDILGDF